MRLTHSSKPQETPMVDPAPRGRGMEDSLSTGTEMRVGVPMPPEFKATANHGVAQGETRVKSYETRLTPDQVAHIRSLVAELIAEGCLNSKGTCNCGMFAEEMEVHQIVPGVKAFYGSFLDGNGAAIDDDHAWAYLEDGTIIDATLDQFNDAIDGEGHPGTHDIAVVPPGHPFYRHYDTTGMS